MKTEDRTDSLGQLHKNATCCYLTDGLTIKKEEEIVKLMGIHNALEESDVRHPPPHGRGFCTL